MTFTWSLFIIHMVTSFTGYVDHNCFWPPFLFVEDLLSTGPTLSSFNLLVEMVLPLHFFPTIHVVRTRPAQYKKTPP